MLQRIKNDIIELMNEINDQLVQRGVTGKIYLHGGAALAMTTDNRRSTMDLDVVITEGKKDIMEIARELSAENNLPSDWINEEIKPFLSKKGSYVAGLQLSNLTVVCASSQYMLALKCQSCRMGLHNDVKDIKSLLTTLKLKTISSVEAILGKYFDIYSYDALCLDVVRDIFDGNDDVYNYL